MRMSVIKKSTLVFLRQLSSNNNREWFSTHKDAYLQAKENAEQFVDALIQKMSVHDQLETSSGKQSLFRIYNDVRFSKDKAPYNARFFGYLKRLKPALRGGYYFWIKPGDSRVGCGFIHPGTPDLTRVRHDISANHDTWKKILKTKAITTTFGAMRGEQVKTTPRGFSADDPAIGLLRYKQYWFERHFTDQEVLANDFLPTVNKTFKSIRPFFNYMSDVLTTDLNGESLL